MGRIRKETAQWKSGEANSPSCLLQVPVSMTPVMALHPGGESWFQSPASFCPMQNQPCHLQSQDVSPELLRDPQKPESQLCETLL